LDEELEKEFELHPDSGLSEDDDDDSRMIIGWKAGARDRQWEKISGDEDEESEGEEIGKKADDTRKREKKQKEISSHKGKEKEKAKGKEKGEPSKKQKTANECESPSKSRVKKLSIPAALKR